MFFRIIVIVFTSVGGGAMLILGTVGLLLHVDSIQEPVRAQFLLHPAVLPLLVATAAVVGIVYQQRGGQAPQAEHDDE